MNELKKKMRNKGRQVKQLALGIAQGIYARAYIKAKGDALVFDPVFYLNQYPDIKNSGTDPFSHYVFHGRKEGRVGHSPVLNQSSFEMAQLDPAHETVIVVSHEASRTGAPILSLNLIMMLKHHYNVIAMVLGGGELTDEFKNSGAVFIDATGMRFNPDHARVLIDKICSLNSIKFALINSVESRVVLQGLAANFVPSISLLHEFSAYTRPKTAFMETMFWSTRTVFSSSVIHQSAVRDFPNLADFPVHILPQGRCEVTFADVDEEKVALEEVRLRNIFKELKVGHKRIVLGAGLIQLRKGVDLFIDCAARVLESGQMDGLHFVWVGKGYDPEGDVQYSAYLHDQILRAGLEDHVTFIPETSAIHVVYDEAAAVLITSRLDPLPNVAIDAMSLGLPVLCFDKTTGIVDFLEECGLRDACVARYLHVPDMARQLAALMKDETAVSSIGKTLKEASARRFAMQTYIDGLESIAKEAIAQTRQEKADYITIEQADVYRSDFIPRYHRTISDFDTLRMHGRSWASNIKERRLFPGFHPAVFAEQSKAYTPGQNPLASYLRAGKPEGPWVHEILTPASTISTELSNTRIALHVHVFYADLFEQILDCLSVNTVRPDLFLSAPSESVKAELEALSHKYPGKVIAIEVVPNKGRDIGPFLSAFNRRHLREYEIIGHLHTKKSKDQSNPEVGSVWYDFLLENLLGKSNPMADVITSKLVSDPRIGMVFADDPHIVCWGKNRPYAEELQARLALNPLPENIVFPVGTMFWARTESLRSLDALELSWSDYPDEPLPYDGSMLHALERLFPLIVQSNGYDIALTNVKSITR
ncbi:rhamnan synthesis F family protein [Pseudomonas putida]|uniref:Group 1 glycosyl transferase n=1 Tax=Pseudomonas putida TaxID=303 RepID=A0A2C5W1H7_PSEPU|nr:rhamnan synthesis F family protein [Pseudomonas putida]PHH40015.1 group 1 glycosyl transferase [Pseudomonas putida]